MVLRQLHRWLHQHIFKVGWLLSKNFQTTTILYYTFFLPGIALHEISYWLMAGILNVRADRAISWPEAQEIGQLNLNFVKLAKNVPSVKLAIITLTPLVAGLLAIWHIANNILNVSGFLTVVSSGQVDLPAAFAQLSSAPDFWLWCYIIFTVSNTMIPNVKDLGGLKIILVILAVVTVALFWIGVGDEVLSQTLNGITSGLSALNGVFAVMIAVNLTATGVLGLAESIIERITGDSATFVKGKLVAMTREEMLKQRAQQIEQERKPREARARGAMAVGPPSVYKLPLPIPSAPGKEPVSAGDAIIVEREKPPALPTGAVRDDRTGPAVITGAVAPDKVPPPSAAPGQRPPAPSPSGTQPAVQGQRPGTQSPAASQPGTSGDRPALTAPPGGRPSVTSGAPPPGGPRPPDSLGAPALSGPRPPTPPGVRPPTLTPPSVPVQKPEPDEDQDVEDELPEGDVFSDLYDDDEEDEDDEDVEDLA